MIIVNYPIPTLVILNLPNFASKQDPHYFFQVYMCLRPKDTHLTLPISATRGDHSWQHWRISIHSMGIDSLWPISGTQCCHSRQYGSMIIHPMSIDLLSPFQQLNVAILSSNDACIFIPWALVCSAHFSNSRWPFKAVWEHVHSSHGH